MNATDVLRAGDPLPRIASVSPLGSFALAVRWNDGREQIADLAPDIFTYKFYKPLRENGKLFASAHVTDDGAAIAWGENDEIDMPATSIERLAGESMEPADFSAFLKRHDLTFEFAAAQLGLSRRLIAYYASERRIPRHVALACKYLDARLAQRTKKTSERAGVERTESHDGRKRPAMARRR